MFKRIKITTPLVNKYCQGTSSGWSICLTTQGPKDQKIPAISTTGIAAFGFLISGICNFYYYFIYETRKYNQFNKKSLKPEEEQHSI